MKHDKEHRIGKPFVVLFAYHLAAFVRVQSGCRPEVIK
jgi:hypothetical protein